MRRGSLSPFFVIFSLEFCLSIGNPMELFAQTIEETLGIIQPMSSNTFAALSLEDEENLSFLPAFQRDFELTGRMDHSDPQAPVMIWQGCQARFRFTGRKLGLRFDRVEGRNFFNVIVDGEISLLNLGGSVDLAVILEKELSEGDHEAIVFKRTEAMFGTARFLGIFLERGAGLLPKPEPKRVKIEFYGDSITAGACDEDPGEDNYDDLSMHNNYTSYGAITARALDAEYSNISFSGIGICVSWNPLLMPLVWDRLYPSAESQAFDFADRAPDLVVVNLGQNDFGFTQNSNLPFPANFKEKHVELLKAMRARYPDSWLICASGGMSAVNSSRDFTKARTQAFKEFAGDPKFLSMTFRAFTYKHPRVDTHLKMARELEAFIRKNVKLESIAP
jgi:lysophospholipase L1-like esterase